jgi:hypothetical protein
MTAVDRLVMTLKFRGLFTMVGKKTIDINGKPSISLMV